ncbi:hypothetical protein A0H81_12348 [Grifola frondosa]|uniref:Cytochrome P450 n=1 Tax=Grifola frondosa TaxID=5627 RepID=A0A1C7LST0_GRIFR|nr:hypothetical protein A0H81_12348 [Grifola frondosa]
MVSVLLQSILFGIVTWLMWRIFRHLILKSPLDLLPGPSTSSFWTGHLKQLIKPGALAFHKEIAETYGPVFTIRGLFRQRILYVYDPNFMHQIVLKQQDLFEKSPLFVKSLHNLFGPGLLGTMGAQHRRQRKLLNPLFSVNHLRSVTPIFYEVCHKLRDAIESRVHDGPQEVDMLSWMSRAALELIGQSGLGYSFDPLVEDRPDAYGDALKTLIPTLSELGLIRRLNQYIPSWVPLSLRRKIFNMIPHKGFQKLQAVADTLHSRSIEIFLEKKAAVETGDEVGEAKDIMSVLLKANMQASVEDRLPEDEVIAQMSTITFAAMDTTSSALSRILHLLAQYPIIQEKLREEILKASEDRDLSYDDLVDLPYLDAVCRETLRLHAPVPFLMRECCGDTVLQLSEPVLRADGSTTKKLAIPKGTKVLISMAASNCSKALWGEDADEWKPERWLSPLPTTIMEAPVPGVYSHLMTFFGGPRACIGFKFSQLEMKVALCTLLSNFTFGLSDKPIVWNFGPVSFPSVGQYGGRPQLPVKVELLKR